MNGLLPIIGMIAPPAFTAEMGVVFFVIAVAFVALAMEWLSADVTGLLTLALLMLFGVLSPEEGLKTFASPAPITAAGMFILGAGLLKTGALDPIGPWLLQRAGGSELSVLAALLAMEIVVSAFINNTAVVIVFLPIATALAIKSGIAPSKLAIPVSYGAILGGTCTLIGTSSNITVSGFVTAAQLKPLGMFEFSLLGLAVAATGIIYMLTIGHRFLPKRETLTSLLQTTSTKEFRTEAVIVKGSPFIGVRLGETPLRKLSSVRILGISRNDRPLDPPFDQIIIAEGDRLTVSTVAEGVRDIDDITGVDILPKALQGISAVRSERITLIEGIIAQNSRFIGRTLREMHFQTRYNVHILGVHRHGLNLREKFEDTALEFGDCLLMEGSRDDIDELRDDPSFLLLSPVAVAQVRRQKAITAIAVMLVVIALAPFFREQVWVLAITGSLAMVLTGCLKINEAYEAVNWKIVLLIVGMMGLGMALKQSNGAAFIAQHALAFIERAGGGSHATVICLYLIGAFLANIVAPNAVASLLTPIAIATAVALNLDARPFIIAALFAASASFSTPVAYQCNTFAYGAGGYRFTDFLKIGLPLNLLLAIVISLLIPLLWPFTPLGTGK